MFGYIEKNNNGSYTIKTDGHNKHTFYGYSKRAAIAEYRRMNNLKYKHITWLDAWLDI